MISQRESRKCRHCGILQPNDSQFCPACGESSDSPASAMNVDQSSSPLKTLGAQPTLFPEPKSSTNVEWDSGEKFANRYEIKKLLGRGGMGTVYLARDEVSGRDVAIKLLNTEHYSQSDTQRLIDEGILARDIRHPNVVAVYDADIFDGQPYLTMEYLAGSTLRELLRRKQVAGDSFSFAEAAIVVFQVLEGLKAAHLAQVVHRDLKPENIMVFENPQGEVQVKILDFGIAKNETQSRHSGSTAGTVGYMSPEQFTSADLVGPTSDLYSLSVIFYELLVGALPRGHWQPPSHGRNDVPRRIDELIESGLSNRAQNRPESAREYQAIVCAAGVPAGRLTGGIEREKSIVVEWNKIDWMNSLSDWWKQLTFQAKAWIIAGIILVIGIIGVAVDELSPTNQNANGGFQNDSYQMPFDPNDPQWYPHYGEPSPW